MTYVKNKKFDLLKSNLGQGAILISSLIIPIITSTKTNAMINGGGNPITKHVLSKPPLGGTNTVYGRLLLFGPDTHTRN